MRQQIYETRKKVNKFVDTWLYSRIRSVLLLTNLNQLLQPSCHKCHTSFTGYLHADPSPEFRAASGPAFKSGEPRLRIYALKLVHIIFSGAVKYWIVHHLVEGPAYMCHVISSMIRYQNITDQLIDRKEIVH